MAYAVEIATKNLLLNYLLQLAMIYAFKKNYLGDTGSPTQEQTNNTELVS